LTLSKTDFFLKATVMSIESVRSNESTSKLFSAELASPAEIPAWLKDRRERPSGAPKEATTTEPSGLAVTVVSAAPSVPPKLNRKQKAAARTLQLIDSADKSKEKKDEDRTEFEWLMSWITRNGTIGFASSLLMHSVFLLLLALIFVTTTSSRDTLNRWGIIGDGDEVGGDSTIDTVLPVDAGESAPMETAAISEAWESIEGGMAIAESTRVGFGGKGHGMGDAGNGIALGVPRLGVPGHAQTKGNFSAWTDPRDPKPHENYTIVIQVRLPESVRKFRASDISGFVSGTDGYRKKISFKSSEQLAAENGVVEIRIPIPGAELRVRDTIQIESKMLKEKQTFEIEF
jgi:hypothetical protein